MEVIRLLMRLMQRGYTHYRSFAQSAAALSLVWNTWIILRHGFVSLVTLLLRKVCGIFKSACLHFVRMYKLPLSLFIPDIVCMYVCVRACVQACVLAYMLKFVLPVKYTVYSFIKMFIYFCRNVTAFTKQRNIVLFK